MATKKSKNIDTLLDVLKKNEGVLKILHKREGSSLYKKALAEILEAIELARE